MHWHDTKEFNLIQDVAAARVIFGCGAPVVQLPCMGVVSDFKLSEADLTYWLLGKNKICDYLARNTIEEASSYAKGKPWTRVIWDVTAVAWLIDGRFFCESLEKARFPNMTVFTHMISAGIL
jgi:inosine-uridine nucleoside N-ribohydrolase